jgi:hypothetical protein
MRFIALIAILLVSSTASAGWNLAEPDTVATASSAGFSVRPPAGWIYDAGSKQVVAARNGMLLDGLRVALIPHKNMFTAINKPLTRGMLPEDLAEAYVAEMQAAGTYTDVKLVSIDPAELSGLPAFRVRLTYRLPASLGGATMVRVAVGTRLTDGILLATFDAPQIHFFEESLPAAEEALRSVTLSTWRKRPAP